MTVFLKIRNNKLKNTTKTILFRNLQLKIRKKKKKKSSGTYLTVENGPDEIFFGYLKIYVDTKIYSMEP